MTAKLEAYLNEFLHAIASEDGLKLAGLLSFKDGHCHQILKPLRQVRTRSSMQ